MRLIQSGVFLAVLHKLLDLFLFVFWSLRLFYVISQSLSSSWKMKLLIQLTWWGGSHREVKWCVSSVWGLTKCPSPPWFYSPLPISPVWGGLAPPPAVIPDSSLREQVLGANLEPLEGCPQSLSLPGVEQGSWLIAGPPAGRGKAHAQKYSELLLDGTSGSEKPMDQWASQYSPSVPTWDRSTVLVLAMARWGCFQGSRQGGGDRSSQGSSYQHF